VIATSLFIALLLLDAALIAIAFLATGNRLYADILSAVGSAILSWYLALAALGGSVGDITTVALTTAENTTTNITTIEYGTLTATTVDPALGLLLSGIAAVMTTVSLALIISLGLEIMKELQ